MGPKKARVLVTGFEPFPGAPHNPTADLVEALSKTFRTDCALKAAVLPVSYASALDALADANDGFDAHIALHFGLARSATAIRLETTARNAIAIDRPDNDGETIEAGCICDGAPTLTTGLPIDTIDSALKHRGIPVIRSDDAGGYLCNFVFYNSCAGRVKGLSARTAGFIHVPPIGAAHEGRRFTADDLLATADIAIACSVEALTPSPC